MTFSISWFQLLSAVLHAAASGLLFVYTVNRRLGVMKNSLGKKLSVLGMLLSYTLGPAIFGWWLGGHHAAAWWWPWVIPGIIFIVWLSGDVHMSLERRRLRGTQPDSITPQPGIGLAFLRKPVTTTDLSIVSYTLPWPGPDLTLVHLSDLHLNHALPRDYYDRVMAQSNQQEPDLVFLSGDLVSYSNDIPLIPPLLERLETTRAVRASGVASGKALFASLGNHDYWAGAERICRALAEPGVSLMSGKTLQATKDGMDFLISADDRPWGPGINLPPGEMLVGPGLVLSHSPDNFYKLASIPGFRAIFSGHVHAGQFRLPLPWGSTSIILPSAYGRQLDHGHFTFPWRDAPLENRVHLFVNAGIGAAEPPVRLYCPPEILVVRFRSVSMKKNVK